MFENNPRNIPVVENVVLLLDVAVKVGEMKLLILSQNYRTYIGTECMLPCYLVTLLPSDLKSVTS